MFYKKPKDAASVEVRAGLFAPSPSCSQPQALQANKTQITECTQESKYSGPFHVYHHAHPSDGYHSFPTRLRQPSGPSPLEVSEDGTTLTHTGRNAGKEVISFSNTSPP
jgi:hypothetical protein